MEQIRERLYFDSWNGLACGWGESESDSGGKVKVVVPNCTAKFACAN